jgi:hypothetical protein
MLFAVSRASAATARRYASVAKHGSSQANPDPKHISTSYVERQNCVASRLFDVSDIVAILEALETTKAA